MRKPLVSVLIPCYNMEKKINRLLESLLHQSYKNLELIFVNDGSKDRTADIIENYKSKYIALGMTFNLIQKQNEGPGGAVNTGLKYVSGDYLVWPDADDWLETDSIEKRVLFLEKHSEYGTITSNAFVYYAGDFNMPKHNIVKKVNRKVRKEDQFLFLLRYQSLFCPGCHMIRMKMFDAVCSGRDIFPSKWGQNFQILLPMYYKYKRAFMNLPLYNYVVYGDSLSHSDSDKNSVIRRLDGLLEIIRETLNRIEMPADKRKKYMRIAEIDDAKLKMRIAFKYDDQTLMNEQYMRIKSIKGWDITFWALITINKNRILKKSCYFMRDILFGIKERK